MMGLEGSRVTGEPGGKRDPLLAEMCGGFFFFFFFFASIYFTRMAR